MTRLTAVVFAALVTLGAEAQAQGIAAKSNGDLLLATPARVLGTPTNREIAYGDSIGRALGRSANTDQVRHTYPLTAEPLGARGTTRGIRVQAGDVTVDRFRFPSEQAAFDYAMYGADLSDPSMVEVRGKQVVVVRGPVADPERADTLMNAAWAGGLPTPPGAPSASAIFLGNGDQVIHTRQANPEFDEAFDKAVSKAKEKTDAETPGFSKVQGGYDFALSATGFTGAVTQEGDARSVVTAQSPARRALMAEHADRMAASADDAEQALAAKRARNALQNDPLQGASNALNGLFD